MTLSDIMLSGVHEMSRGDSGEDTPSRRRCGHLVRWRSNCPGTCDIHTGYKLRSVQLRRRYKILHRTANKDVSTFTGNVGSGSGTLITVTTTGNVDTGSGFSTIKPTKGANLTDLIFAPDDDTLFNDFSFRGQLESSGFTGTVDVKWTDSSGGIGKLTVVETCLDREGTDTGFYAAWWTQISWRQTRKALTQVQRYLAAVMRWRRGRK